MAETSTKLGRVSLVPRGEYDPQAQYQRLDIVRYDGSSYLALRDLQGVTPEDGADYMLISEKGGKGDRGVSGDAAGFGAVSATVDDTSGTPSVDVSSAGPDNAKEFSFAFHGLKGERGIRGVKGDTGETGNGIASIERTSGTGAAGTTDTYTITMTDGSTAEFQVYNGADGAGAGDMTKSVYDPHNKNTDVFAYVDEAMKNVKVDVDDTPAKGSPNPVSSGGTYAGLATKQDALTGLPGQVVRFDGMGLPYAAEGWSGRNLLINSDFRRPVNRNGAGTWSIGVGVDCWIISTTAKDGMYAVVNPGYLTLQYISGISEFYQAIRGSVFESLRGKTVTLSCLINSDVHTLTTHIPESGPVELSIQLPSGWLLGVYSNGNGFSCARIYAVSEADTVALYAVKLEFGDHQTLARQNEDGEWELIDPPDYDLQYALCSLYSPSTGEWVGYQHSNLNLLDNWLLVDPVNQKGEKSYSANGYGIDRWLQSSSITEITDDGIRFSSVDGTRTGYLSQNIPDGWRFVGRTLTLSALLSDGSLYSCTGVCPKKPEPNGSSAVDATIGVADIPIGIGRMCLYYNSGDYLRAWFRGTAPFTLKAVKLELGPVQTLAHQDADGNWVLNDPPPNKVLEELKCLGHQMYMSKGTICSGIITAGGTEVRLVVPTPVPMRTVPTLVDGMLTNLRFVEGTNMTPTVTSYKVLARRENQVEIAFTVEGVEVKNNTPCAGYVQGLLDAN